MKRRRRYQQPKPRKEGNLWKLRYYMDEPGPDGLPRRVRRTKCLGRVDEMTAAEAKREAAAFLMPVNACSEPACGFQRTFGDLLEKYRTAVLPGIRDSTASLYRVHLLKLYVALGTKPLVALDRADIQEFVTRLAATLAPATVRSVYSLLCVVLGYGVEWAWLSVSPATRIRLPRQTPAQPRVVFSPSDLEAVASRLPPKWASAVRLSVYTGLRPAELAALRWNDVLLNGLRVDERYYRSRLGPPKSETSRRVVPLGPATRAVLDSIRPPNAAPTAFIFALPRKPFTPPSLANIPAKYFMPVCKALGLPTLTWRILRRTHATWGRLAGVPVETMRDRLGHSSTRLTQDIYTQTAALDDTAASRIEGYATGYKGNLNGTPNALQSPWIQ